MGKYLDKQGVIKLWGDTKALVGKEIKTNVTDKLGAASGIATLGSDSKISSSQLPAFKTVNGESIVGSGNIAIDLNVYQLVDSLPESNQNPNKIYLVLSGTAGEQNKYTEYVWINNAWEKFGEYDAKVELEDYLKIEDIEDEIKKAGFVTFEDIATSSKDGLLNQKYVKLIESLSNGTVIGKPKWGDDNELPSLEFSVVKVNGTNTSTEDVVLNMPFATQTTHGYMSKEDYNKLKGITAEATKDEAIPISELEEIFV